MSFSPRILTLERFRRGVVAAVLVILSLVATVLLAQRVRRPAQFIYIQDLRHDRVTVAWGGPRGAAGSASLLLGRHSAWLGALDSHLNDVGASSPPHGRAELRVFEEETGRAVPGSPFVTEEANWLDVPLPAASTEYGYELRVNGETWGSSQYGRDLLRFRSFPDPDSPSPSFAFLALGDFGTGTATQERLAGAMARLVDARRDSSTPVRFVVTTGDNLYDSFMDFGLGGDDRQFFVKILWPYRQILSRIPLFPALGNHDGSDRERRDDLEHHRDNFFLPTAVLRDGFTSPFEDRFYSFAFGRDVRFFCLDTTANKERAGRPAWQPIGKGRERSQQIEWLEHELAIHRDVPWKIVYLHHPPYSASPDHQEEGDKSTVIKEAIVPLLEREGVRLVLAGHAHNFQLSRPAGSSGTHYVVTGSGGQVDDHLGSRDDLAAMRAEGVEVTNAFEEPSFVLVEVLLDRMGVVPFGVDARGEPKPLSLRSAAGEILRAPSPFHPVGIPLAQ